MSNSFIRFDLDKIVATSFLNANFFARSDNYASLGVYRLGHRKNFVNRSIHVSLTNIDMKRSGIC